MSVRNRLFAPLVLFLCLAPVVPGRAEAASRRAITSYDVPGCLSGGEDLAPAARKGVLFRACAKRGQRVSGTLAHLMPSGKLLRRRVPKSEPGPILAGPAGEIWSVAKFEKSPVARGEELSIDRIAASGSVRTFPLGSIGGAFGALRVNGLVADVAGAVWLAIGDLKLNYYLQPGDSGGGELLHIAVDGTVSRFPLPDEVEPDGLVRGPDGNLWFTGVSGRATGERTSTPGTGYIGRMTPTGEFALFPTPTAGSGPRGIALGPDGRLWFTETALGPGEVGTIGTDGTFGPSLSLRRGYLRGEIAFGSEGDAWMPYLERGLVRMRPNGRQKGYMQVEGAVVAGREGDIWSLEWTHAWRIVPRAAR